MRTDKMDEINTKYIRERIKKAKTRETDYESCGCDEPRIEERKGMNICVNCGAQIGKRYICEERRAYTQEEVQKRKRTERQWNEVGPRTTIPISKKDSKGNVIKGSCFVLYHRLSKIQNSLVTSIERNFWEAKPKMKLVASKLGIPQFIKETAWKIYKRCASKKLTMGRSIAAFIGGSLYASIRIHEFPIILEEVSEMMFISRRDLHRALGLIVKEILPKMGLKYKSINPHQLVFRFGNDLKLPINMQKKAINMLIRARKKGLRMMGKDPKGFAAASIYLVARMQPCHKKTQKEMSELTKITEVTLRNRCNDIKNTF